MFDARHHHRHRRQLAADLDFADLELMFQKRKDVCDDGVQIYGRARARAGAWTREVEETVDDLCRAERLTLDLLEQHGPGIVLVGALEQHLREARNAGERRVHLVCHTGGQKADRRHLFRNLELLFETDAVGDVLDEQNRADNHRPVARRTLQRHRRRVHQHARLVAGACLRPSGHQRHARQRRAARAFGPRRPLRLHEWLVEHICELSADRIGARNAVKAFERTVPADDPLVGVEHHEPIVERFEDVLVELAHPAQFLGLEVELAVQAAVLDRRGHLAGHRRQERQILAVERLVALFPAEREHRNRAAFEDAGHEIVKSGVPPELHLFGDKPRGGDRIVERDGMPRVEPGDN